MEEEVSGKVTNEKGKYMGNLIILCSIVCCVKSMRWRSSSCDGIYMRTRSMGVRSWYAICRICKYGLILGVWLYWRYFQKK